MNDLIDRRQAIDVIDKEQKEIDVSDVSAMYAYSKCKTIIKQLPPAQLGTNLAEVGTDCISRQKAIEAFNTDVDTLIVYGTENAVTVKRYLNGVLEKIKQLPSAESESFEWCTDCKEYDQEAHCCHRWNKVIKNTLVEVERERRVTT